MVKNYQQLSKNYFFRSQQLSTIKDNSRSQITQITQIFIIYLLPFLGGCKSCLRGGCKSVRQ